MHHNEIFNKIYKGLIVSCQALEGEPLYGRDIMAKMAIAAKDGGAVGIRANYAQDIKAIKEVVDLPIIGLIKEQYGNSQAYITPTMKEVRKVVGAGADIVAIDGTQAIKPDGKSTNEFIKSIKQEFDIIVMADISTYEEGFNAVESGVDMVSTTLSGYTPYSPQIEGPDFELMERLAKDLSVPVIGEGRIWSPEEAVKALKLGVHAVVVGTAITRPQKITERFTKYVDKYKKGLVN